MCHAMKYLGGFFLFWVSVCVTAVPSAEGRIMVFERDAEWRWRKGTSDASTPDRALWRQVSFSDAGWDTGRAPFYYGEPLSGTELPDMRGGYTCVFLRRKFTLAQPAALGGVRLHALSDDGFVAWINGKLVARFNMPEGEPGFGATALGSFNEPLPTETYEIANFADVLVPGENVIAVQACNASISGSSDFVFEAALETEVDDQAPVMEKVVPPPGSRLRSLAQISVVFSEPVEGVDAADLRLNGVPATSFTGFGGDQFVFEFPPLAPGTVTVEWASGAGIRDRSALQNVFGGGRWQYTLDPNLPPPGVTLSEFMADNGRTLNDEDGDASDWIEIENGSDQVVDLTGWALTDDPTRPMSWRFPPVALAARGHLVVFASGKNRTVPTARLHTQFRLSREGGYLALVRPDGTTASSYGNSYPPQTRDISYGRLPTDPLKTGYFPLPTPGAPNTEGGPGFSSEVTFSRVGGTFLEPFMLTLGASGSDAVVRYTLDGTVPTESSPEAKAAIPITTSTRVRARSFTPGLLPGRLSAEYYVPLNPTAAAASTLPLVLIHAFGGGAVPANGEYPAFVSLYEPRLGVSSLTNSPDLRSRARINIRGSSTLFQSKRNYSVEFRDEQEADRDVSPLGLPEESDWVLYAPNNFEPILIHNPFIYRISREIGRYAPRTRFVEVYIQTGNGAVASSQYAGIYVLMEKVKPGRDRVDIDPLEPEHNTPPKVTGGYMLKIDRLDPGDSGFFAGGQVMGFVEPKEEEIRLPQRAPQLAYIQTYLDRFNEALYSANWRSPTLGWRAYVDEDSWIDHHILNVMAFNVDALRLSTFFYKPRDGKLSFGPIWDFDRALNSTDGRDSNPRVWRSGSSDMGTDFFNYPWWGRLFQDPDFWQRWIDRYQELRRGTFQTNYLFRVIDEMTDQVKAAQPREAARWAGFTTPRVSYSNEIVQMKTWLGRRIHFMDTNFLATPEPLVRPTGTMDRWNVEFSGPSGATIYYTTDGLDPRAPGGGVASSARTYSGPIPLESLGFLKARAYNAAHRNRTGANHPPLSSSWSGWVEVRGSLLAGAGTRRLVISEIHARPADPTAQERVVSPLATAGDYEFIEFWNRGPAPADLGDLVLVGGIRFAFATGLVRVLAPDERIVLVRNETAFRQRYGASPRLAGVFEGSLAASGETLKVIDGAGRPVVEAAFRTTSFPAANGLGFALVLREPDTDAAVFDLEAWNVGGKPGGTPGSPEPATTNGAKIVVNEVLSHTDLPQVDGIELHNPGTAPVDISGWYLSDDRERPFRYRIPSGTVLPGGGFAWFDETHFGADPGNPTAFRFDSTGDEAWVFAADSAGNLTGYSHGFDFGAAENGISFGRSVDCLGRESFWPQRAVTPGAANAGPQFGPVVISEIHYRPLDIQVGVEMWNDRALEFIELTNRSDQPVQLFDPAHATNTWRVKDAVNFRFPPNTVIPARGTIVIVPFDPATDPQALASFRRAFEVSAAVSVFGPYSGSLPNGAGRVELARPDRPQTLPAANAGLVPYIVVDRVNYRDEGGWADGDGTGKSMQRVSWSRPDSGSQAWIAATPTPGVVANDSVDRDGDGMPDGWEAEFCLNSADPLDGAVDLDGDRASNRDEFLSGTDPRDPSDVLRWTHAELQDTGRMRLEFVAKAGLAYGVDTSDGLGSAWRRIQSAEASPRDRVIVVEDLAGPGPRFYRVIAIRPR